MVVIAKKYFLRLLLLLGLAYAGYHWYSLYPASQPKEIRPVASFIKDDAVKHWGDFKQAVRGLQAKLTHGINTDDKVRRGAMGKLAHALELYKADHDGYPADIKEATIFYRDYNDLLADPGFKYERSPDGDHFKISIGLKDGQTYSIEK